MKLHTRSRTFAKEICKDKYPEIKSQKPPRQKVPSAVTVRHVSLSFYVSGPDQKNLPLHIFSAPIGKYHQTTQTNMHFRLMPTRRNFVRFTAAALASVFFPNNRISRLPGKSFWLLHSYTRDSWEVRDPVAWCLENINQPVLLRASEGLKGLLSDDADRVIRLAGRFGVP